MAAYVIVRLNVRNNDWVTEYRPKTTALVEKHGGKFRVRRGKMEKLEGKEALPDGMVVIEFPSLEAAKAWHSDPAYAPLIKLRQSGADAEIVVVEGL
jgi:uncharacterized protein (DUF1330 family)